MKSSTKKLATTGALVAALALGGAGVAFATTSPTTGTSSATEASDQEQTFVGTITAPPEANDGETADDATEAPGTETNDDAAEADETAALQKLATVTPEEARAAAVKAVAGTAGKVELESENGYVVYGVEVTAADGTVTDVKIDAGDASVLAQEADGADGPENEND